ncbi:1,4-alpha-glucan branching protein GlgB [Frigidibacter sp. RF13]|uniref:1,4-alpha-glucan branching protein GlgB n=1 Tax=Frigidibacter sp. RF13 TaxID=2997340 RepID=UPI0022719795|nr:1,4-alpha-glucan branching protein GlgB [Frigidibacter sp. RF13]MCY1125631.1 1,4-alpha-glucan branching protein GlgB [Frigidibacter sp. RF13]
MMAGRERFLSTSEALALSDARHGDPFSVLGPHDGWLRTLAPGARQVWAVTDDGRLALARNSRVPDLWEGAVAGAYWLEAQGADESAWQWEDPYRFGPVLGEIDEYLLGEGSHLRLWHVLGAHLATHEGLPGTHFAVWAPNAVRVSVVGDFNQWDGRRAMMRRRGATGVWEIFLPHVGEGAVYKYEILGQAGLLPLKADPVGFGAEMPPATGSRVRALDRHVWGDGDWMSGRATRHRVDAPVSIYEVHLGSWQRDHEGRALTYRELADRLIPYVTGMGFTHIELLPITEHPFDGSWGYQPIGLYAPTCRHGTPEDFAFFVDHCHRAGIGVILDWVPGHFPTDQHGLGRFDGTSLYEHQDPKEGFHQDWNTLIYNYGRREVLNYLIANALYWLEEFHLDGLRVDAVASMLYRDYSRRDGEWVPNKDGGRENYEAIDFLKNMNRLAYGAHSDILTVAEESTAFPGVSRPVDHGGLGFGYKWNMGWMNDTLSYMAKDPIHRRWHHNQMTFALTYAWSENFILPISHDEVVHGKGSMITRMPGDGEQKFANLRALYAYMWCHPGKKLLFMGQEFAQGREWNHDGPLDWFQVDHPSHRGVQTLVRDLNRLYRTEPALHATDTRADGFFWLDADDANRSIYAFVRQAADQPRIAVVANMTPVMQVGYRLGLPSQGHWHEVLNTDAGDYGGAGRGNMGSVSTEPIPAQGQSQSAAIVLPPLSVLVFRETKGE